MWRPGWFHGALGICKSSVCTWNRGPLCPLHSHFVLCPCERAVRAADARGAKRLIYHIYVLVLSTGVLAMVYWLLVQTGGGYWY